MAPSTMGFIIQREGENEQLTFTDSNYAGDLENRKSTSGYVFILSSAAISLSSKK